MRNFARSAGQFGLAAMIAFALASSAFAQRTPLKPGMNFFSPQQDIELGQQVSQDAERQLPMLRRPQVDDYLNRLGKRLAANAPGEKFPYQFKCVNDSTINAFALPGGFLYVNRGTIEAASNEAELAGVMSHEIGHVALRHGTNQASKQYLAQAPLAVLGSVLGGNSAGAILAQIGTGFALNSVLLKYSRDDERQADLMASQILYDSGYDPRYIVSFLEKLGDRGGWEVMSSHPNPQNRVQNINAEIGRLGPVLSRAINDSNEFRSTQRLVKSLPAAPAAGSTQTQTSSSTSQAGRPARPSDRYQSFDAGNMKLSHPDNWTAYGEQQAFTLAPEGGIVSTADMDALAYGAMMAVFTPGSGRRSRPSLEEATNQLIQALQSSNRAMRMAKNNGQISIGGQTARSMLFTNDSPMGGRETDWLVTVLRPEGLVYFVFVAPEQEFAIYQRAFGKILDSIAFYDQ